jgi:hypothetical protein
MFSPAMISNRDDDVHDSKKSSVCPSTCEKDEKNKKKQASENHLIIDPWWLASYSRYVGILIVNSTTLVLAEETGHHRPRTPPP